MTYMIKKKVARTANQSSHPGLRRAIRTATNRKMVAMMANDTPTMARIKQVSCRLLWEILNAILSGN